MGRGLETGLETAVSAPGAERTRKTVVTPEQGIKWSVWGSSGQYAPQLRLVVLTAQAASAAALNKYLESSSELYVCGQVCKVCGVRGEATQNAGSDCRGATTNALVSGCGCGFRVRSEHTHLKTCIEARPSARSAWLLGERSSSRSDAFAVNTRT